MGPRTSLLGGLVITAAACSVVNSPDDPQESSGGSDGSTGGSTAETTTSSGSSSGGAATSSTTTSGTGGAGGDPECTAPADCPPPQDECMVATCDAGSCGTEPAPQGEPCGDATSGLCDSPDTCDGMGSCQPNTAQDGTACDDDPCLEMETCQNGVCSGGTPKDCSSLDSGCTKGVCDPNNGQCVTQTETMCIDADGCCPGGCSSSNDSDCSCATNLATAATPSSSGGGMGTYGTAEMNDGVSQQQCSTCDCFHWISNGTTASGDYIQYDWSQAVTIVSMYLDANGCTDSCSSGRTMFSGDIQYWNGSSWITVKSFSSNSGDYSTTFQSPFTTTKLRIMDVTAGSCGQDTNTMIWEWYVWPAPGCQP